MTPFRPGRWWRGCLSAGRHGTGGSRRATWRGGGSQCGRTGRGAAACHRAGPRFRRGGRLSWRGTTRWAVSSQAGWAVPGQAGRTMSSKAGWTVSAQFGEPGSGQAVGQALGVVPWVRKAVPHTAPDVTARRAPGRMTGQPVRRGVCPAPRGPNAALRRVTRWRAFLRHTVLRPETPRQVPRRQETPGEMIGCQETPRQSTLGWVVLG